MRNLADVKLASCEKAAGTQDKGPEAVETEQQGQESSLILKL